MFGLGHTLNQNILGKYVRKHEEYVIKLANLLCKWHRGNGYFHSNKYRLSGLVLHTNILQRINYKFGGVAIFGVEQL